MRAAAVLVGLLLLTGCGSAGDGSLTGAGATLLPSVVAGSPSVPAGPLVVFTRTGGLAGLAATLTVQPDGAAQVTGRRQASWTLTPGQLDGLRRALAGADLRPVAPSGPPVLDGFSYRITYAGTSVLLASDPVPAGAAAAVSQLSMLAEGP